MFCSHLHVELLIKNHESLNLKVHTNGCFVVSVKQIATVSTKEKGNSYCQLYKQQMDRTEGILNYKFPSSGKVTLVTGNNLIIIFNYVMAMLVIITFLF